MKLLELLIGNPSTTAIGLTLLHSLWEGAIVAAVLEALLLTLRTARARYFAACAALLVLLASLAVTLLRLAPRSADSFPVRIPIVEVGNIVAEGVNSGHWKPDLAAVAPWLALLWMTGVLLMFTRYSVSCISVRRLRCTGVCCAPSAWQSEVDKLIVRLRISRQVRLLESFLAEVPTVVGHFRPLILMPVGMLAGLSPIQIESILLHELAHVRRHDYLINTLQCCVESLLFYHPAVWWISAVIRREREHCCDDFAVSISGDPYEYADALAALEQNRFSPVAVAATGGSLVKRIHRLLYPRTRGSWAPFVAVLLFALTAVATVAAWPKPSQSNIGAKQQEKERALEPAYSKWLSEDVGYIISQAERSAFLRLANSGERDKFIEEFWERRNPTPGAPNKFKEEHYQRLAYANQHFASRVPGWKTDRGRIYILYGPPDELEAYPHAVVPTEIWLYRHVDGVGDKGILTFVDRTGRGDFRLSPGAPFLPKSPGPAGKQP